MKSPSSWSGFPKNNRFRVGKDTYQNFSQLSRREVLNRDYQIRVRDLGADITIMAPHGGRIEPNTSEVTRHICQALQNVGISVSRNQSAFPGRHPGNICNLGQLEKGVQLEVSRGLRDRPEKIQLLSTAVNHALGTFTLD